VSTVQKKEVPYGYIIDGDIFLSGYNGYPDRKIGVVKESEQATVDYFINKYELLRKKIEDLRLVVRSSQNKGSFLMKLQHLRDTLPQYDGLGDYVPLFEMLEEIEVEIKSLVEHNRERNLEIKKALLDEIEPYKTKEDWKEIIPFYKDFKLRWLKTGRVVEEKEEEIEGQYQKVIEYFTEKRRAYLEALNIELAAKAVHFDKLIEQADAIKDHPNLKMAKFQFRKLFQDWKQLGKVPKSEEYDPWAKFREISDHFYKRLKESKSQRPPRRFDGQDKFNRGPRTYGNSPRPEGVGFQRLPFTKPEGHVDEETVPKLLTERDRLEYKLKLCQRAEALRNEETPKAIAQGRKLQELWKNSGLVPRLRKKELQDRFRNAIDIVFQKRSIYINARKLEENYTSLSKGDQVKTQIIALKAMIREDENELREMEDNAGNQSSRSDVFTMDKIIAGKLHEQRRKISVKNLLLHELELLYLASN
jgi:hypothetical protein